MCVSPGEWESNCDELQKMVVVRCLRQDRVSSCVTTFVINHLGARFVEPPVLDMKAVSFCRSLFPVWPRGQNMFSLWWV